MMEPKVWIPPQQMMKFCYLMVLTFLYGLAFTQEGARTGLVGHTTYGMHVGSRKIPLHVWYPAIDDKKNKSMIFIDYVKSDKNSFWDHKTPMNILSEIVDPYIDSIQVRSVVLPLAHSTVYAFGKAKPLNDKFPLVVISNGLNSPGFVQTIMAEYLAQHGCVVLCMPHLPVSKNNKMEFNQKAIQIQLYDLEKAILKGLELPYVDKNRLYLIGWSMGNATQIIYQMKTKKAKALISLDGASQYEYGWDLIKQSNHFSADFEATPFLQFNATAPRKYQVPRSSHFIDSIATNNIQIFCPHTSHAGLLSLVYRIYKSTDKKIDFEYESMLEKISQFIKTH